MILAISLLCFLFSAAVSAGDIFLRGLLPVLPRFTATAAALIGVLIAAMEYRVRKTKKKRRAPMALLIMNACAGILAAGYWLYLLLV